MSFHVIILIINLIAMNSVYSQGLFNLYKDHLPETVLKNKKYQENINITLKTYAQLDPKLIYIYLKKLELKFDYKIQNRDSNFTTFLNFELNKVKELKSKWAQQQIDLINKRYNSSVKVNHYNSLFPEYSINKVLPSKQEYINKQSNVKDFFRYIYLSRKENISYDASINFKELCNNKASEIVQEFEQIYDSKELLNEIQVSKIVEKAFDYPFLFKNGYLKSYTNRTKFFIFELLDKFYKKDFISHNSLIVYLPFQLFSNSTSNHTHTYKVTDPFNKTYISVNEIPYNNPLFFPYLGFQYKTRKEYNPFSFVKVKIGYSFKQDLKKKLKDKLLFDGLVAKGGLFFKGKYLLTNYKEFKSFSISTQCTTPIYYLTRNIFFEVGFKYILQNISLKYDFLIEVDELRAQDPKDEMFFSNNNRKITIDEYYHKFSPLLSTGFFIDNGLSFSLDYIIPNIISLGVGYQVKL